MSPILMFPIAAEVCRYDLGKSDVAAEIRGVFLESGAGTTWPTSRKRFNDFAERSLMEAIREYSEELGSDARAISVDAYGNALRFIEMLREDLPLPDFAINPDGHVGLDWRNGPDRALSIRILADGRIVYAGIDGDAKFHGVETLGHAIPVTIATALDRIL